MARPSVAAIGKAVVSTANIIVDVANVLSTSSNALTHLAQAGSTTAQAYATNVKFRAKAEEYDSQEAILDEVALSIANRKADLQVLFDEDKNLASAYTSQREALKAHIGN